MNATGTAAGTPSGHVAIIGCGPSGCYTAIALRKLAPNVEVSVFDGRPTPFGLLRYGVAADHQGMKGVSRQFDRLFASPQVHFVGNTVVGRDVALDDVEAAFDVVVIATGLSQDRPLDFDYPSNAPVFGAGQVLRMLNSDPDSRLTTRDGTPAGTLGEHLLIVGSGNVAMDLARLVYKSEEGFAGSDINDDARAILRTAEVRHITILSRSPRERVRWDPAMFAELAALPGVVMYTDGQPDTAADDALKQDAHTERGQILRVDVRFNQTPVSITAQDGRTVVHTRRTDGQGPEGRFTVDSVVTATGFIRPDPTENPVAHAEPERFVWVGGALKGALGNLAENRAMAKGAAEQIVQRLSPTGTRGGLQQLQKSLTHDITAFDDWQALDRAEIERARPSRVRTKFTTREEMSTFIAEHRRSTRSDPQPVPPSATDHLNQEQS